MTQPRSTHGLEGTSTPVKKQTLVGLGCDHSYSEQDKKDRILNINLSIPKESIDFSKAISIDQVAGAVKKALKDR